jgi:hypothetical protein
MTVKRVRVMLVLRKTSTKTHGRTLNLECVFVNEYEEHILRRESCRYHHVCHRLPIASQLPAQGSEPQTH